MENDGNFVVASVSTRVPIPWMEVEKSCKGGEEGHCLKGKGVALEGGVGSIGK